MEGIFNNKELIKHLEKSLEIVKNLRKNKQNRADNFGFDVSVTDGMVTVLMDNTSDNMFVYRVNLYDYCIGEVGLIRATNKTTNRFINFEEEVKIKQIQHNKISEYLLRTSAVNVNIAQVQQVDGFYTEREKGHCVIQVPPTSKIEVVFYFKSRVKAYYNSMEQEMIKNQKEILDMLKKIP